MTSTRSSDGQCGSDMAIPPEADWSTDKLTADCSGHYKLCYTLRANASAGVMGSNDCSIIQVCTEADYATAGVAQAFPALPGWANDTDLSCEDQFFTNGGHGDMSVEGTSSCGPVKRVFAHVTYCPSSCNGQNPPAFCATCVPGGGVF
jgi:hypothetical protein